MGNFIRGQVFNANLPETKFTRKINPPSPIPNGERYVVVLHDANNTNYDPRQVLIAPIFKESEIAISSVPLLISHIQMKVSEYDFLGEDSYISTHQIMPINRGWFNVHPVGKIEDIDLIYRMDLGIIHAAGLMGIIHEIIKDEAEKQQLSYARPPVTPPGNSVASTRTFTRGDVYFGQLPEQDYSNHGFPPSFTLEGEYRVVVLHDSHNPNYDPQQVLIVPITKAETAVKTGAILPTHIPLIAGEFPFIRNDCFVSTHQIFSISRDWLDPKQKGNLLPRMAEVDLALLLAGDLTATKDRIVFDELEKLTLQALREIEKQEKDA
jgi:hypothetical protein